LDKIAFLSHFGLYGAKVIIFHRTICDTLSPVAVLQWAGSRVTRLVEFLPLGQLFSLGRFLCTIPEKGHIFGLLISTEKSKY
jgi:hypothetical protein